MISAPGTEDEDEGATSTGDQVPGTRAYMAPEQYSSYKGITGLEGRMDVYALGCILYLSLAGRLPLYDREHVVMMGLTLAKEPDPLLKINPSIPPELAELAHLMLVKEAVDRPTMVHVRDRLVNFLGLSESRAEIVAIRPTAEHQAMLAKFSTGEQEEERAATGDLHAFGAIKAVKSVGERSTKMQLTSADFILSTGRSFGEQRTGPDTAAQRRSTRVVGLVLLGTVAVSGIGGAVAFWLPMRPKQAVISPPPSSRPSVLSTATTEGIPVATSASPAGALTASQPATPSPAPTVPETAVTKQPKQKVGCVVPTDDCISGGASAAQRGSILEALQENGIKFCQGDRMVFTGKPILMVRINSGVKHRGDNYLYAARSKLKKTTFDGEVEVKCKSK